MIVAITCDPAKRNKTMVERGLDFLDAQRVFDGRTFDFQDMRQDYGEDRFICVGRLGSRTVVIGWTPRGEDRHVFSMRKANERERRRYSKQLG